MRLPPQHLRVVQQRAAVAGLQVAVGRDPCIEQAGGFERGFEAGALRSRDRSRKSTSCQSGAPARMLRLSASRV